MIRPIALRSSSLTHSSKGQGIKRQLKNAQRGHHKLLTSTNLQQSSIIRQIDKWLSYDCQIKWGKGSYTTHGIQYEMCNNFPYQPWFPLFIVLLFYFLSKIVLLLWVYIPETVAEVEEVHAGLALKVVDVKGKLCSCAKDSFKRCRAKKIYLWLRTLFNSN